MFILLCMQSYETAITLISRVMWNFDEIITWRIVLHVSNVLKMITSVCTMQSKNMPVRLAISSLKIVFRNLVDDAYNKTVWRTGYIFGIHLRVATVDVLVCLPFDLLTSQSVDVSVCRRFGLSTFRVIAVSVYRRFGLSKFRYVRVLIAEVPICRRLDQLPNLFQDLLLFLQELTLSKSEH